ncbi:MAG: Flp family type IVb pilin [Alphaproteobacteria bacterium HGW-Alphaproteobacteria-18]|nr:MAG: Flp family type IVb pilin [Alphaproteobacteria bacterium HGW-Alphaproteobacteria-18]
MFARFLKDESGATAIEYGLIAALIAVAIIGGVSALGGQTAATFDSVTEGMKNAPSGGEGGGEG